MLTPFEVQGDVKVWDGLEVRDNREDGIFQLKEPGPVEGHEVGAIVPGEDGGYFDL